MELSTAPAPLFPTRLQRVQHYRVLWLFAAAVVIVDQLTKQWVVTRLPFNPLHLHDGVQDHPIIPGFFYIIHVGNTGAAWSLFAGRSIFLALLALLTLGAIFFWRRALGLQARIVQVSFGLLCGGIFGNLIDRLRHHHVIDFLDFHFGSYVYPTFNVADSGICVGVIIYLLWSLRQPNETKL